MDDKEKELRRVRARIIELTGRVPTSSNLYHLKTRLADLEVRHAAGEDLKRERGSLVYSISMPTAAGRAFDDVAKMTKLKHSELVRRALAEWARNNGFADAAAAIGVDQ